MKPSLFSDKKFKIDSAPSNQNVPSQPTNSVEEITVLDKDKIYECFRIILTAPNEELRKQADMFLFQCEKNPMLYSFLLEIFETTPVYFFF